MTAKATTATQQHSNNKSNANGRHEKNSRTKVCSTFVVGFQRVVECLSLALSLSLALALSLSVSVSVFFLAFCCSFTVRVYEFRQKFKWLKSVSALSTGFLCGFPATTSTRSHCQRNWENENWKESEREITEIMQLSPPLVPHTRPGIIGKYLIVSFINERSLHKLEQCLDKFPRWRESFELGFHLQYEQTANWSVIHLYIH